jgi:cytochrome c
MFKLFFVLMLAGFTTSALAREPSIHPKSSNESPRAQILAGRHIAERNCQTCHAISKIGASPNPRSPPLRTLSTKYPIDSLQEAFAEGVLVGHSDMPEFMFEPAQIDALLAYVKSIQVRPKARLKSSKHH